MRVALFALLIGCTSPKPPPPASPQPKVHELACITSTNSGTIECDGLRYDVTIPKGCGETILCGLVLDIHGLSMSARMEDANTNMRALGEKYGYVVIQPNANPAPPDRSFGLPDPKMPIWLPEDDERIYAFLEHAIEKLVIDRDRVHMTGFSLGAMMTWRIFCKHAETFASIAPAAGAQGCAFDAHEMPSKEVSILYLHGHADQLVPFYSGKELRDRIVTAWRMRPIAGINGVRYVNRRGTILEFVQHTYQSKYRADLGGHCIPGSHDPGDAPGQKLSFACEGPTSFVWGELAMDFFRAYPRDH
jgi:poly(3-hydroxybutyrate) depolymerase